jgi:hypothetical protein
MSIGWHLRSLAATVVRTAREIYQTACSDATIPHRDGPWFTQFADLGTLAASMTHNPKKQQSDLIFQQGRAWVYWADFDWVSARILFLKRNSGLWMSAGALGHKALEQYLKAFHRSHGDGTKWSWRKGHDLPLLAERCADYDEAFSEVHLVHQLKVFYGIYDAWRYPEKDDLSRVPAEAQVPGDDTLTALDETVAEIRPRIRLAELGLPPTFEDLHTGPHGGAHFVVWAKENNPSFDRMEQSSKKRNPRPTWEQLSRSQISPENPNDNPQVK